jgi:predicted N-formylglutamate amidohydrolase
VIAGSLFISCEHGGHEVPESYQLLFVHDPEVLATHRGWDPGAAGWATHLANVFQVPLRIMFTTRLLIEMNRAPESPQLFSEYSSGLPEEEKQKLIESLYVPYRTGVEELIRHQPQPVLHVSVHSFTPFFNGQVRDVDIGILFDPERNAESEFCQVFRRHLQAQLPGMNIRFNEPYRGVDDGIATDMRKKFPGSSYLGIELEINQRFASTPHANHIQEALVESLRKSLAAD